MLPTKMLKDELNRSMLCRHKLILYQRITLGTWFPDCKERTLRSVDGSTRPNLPLKVFLSDIKHAYLGRDFIKKKALNTLKHFPLLQR
jgi:hypothetical protein